MDLIKDSWFCTTHPDEINTLKREKGSCLDLVNAAAEFGIKTMVKFKFEFP